MSNKKNILFVCNEPNYNLHNRRSAIDSILCSTLEVLTQDYNIWVNGVPFEEGKQSRNDQVIQSKSSLKSMAVKALPKSLKESIKMKRLLNHTNELGNRLMAFDKKVDYIFELYKLGSDLGKKLVDKFDAKYVLYYDSPVVEQYEDIWQAKAPFRDVLIERQKSCVQVADTLIAYSEPVEAFLKKMGAKGEVRLFQTLDYSRLTETPQLVHDELNIGFIGSFMAWHEVDLLVKAFESLCKDGWDNIHLHLIGDGEKRPEIMKHVSSSPYKSHIHLPGFMDGQELEQVKSRLDIGVMPGSNWYGMPTKVYEYGACGIASIAPKTPTIEYLFKDGEDVALFEWGNQEDLKEKLITLLQDQSLRNKMRQTIQTKVKENHTKQKALNFYKGLFR